MAILRAEKESESVERCAIDAGEARRFRHVRPGAGDQLREVLLFEVRDELLLREVEAFRHDVDR